MTNTVTTGACIIIGGDIGGAMVAKNLAKACVVAGAGLAGVEVAGELKAAFPDTKLALVGA